MPCRVRVSSPEPLPGAQKGALGPGSIRTPGGNRGRGAAGLGLALKAPLGEEGTWAGGEHTSLGH